MQFGKNEILVSIKKLKECRKIRKVKNRKNDILDLLHGKKCANMTNERKL